MTVSEVLKKGIDKMYDYRQMNFDIIMSLPVFQVLVQETGGIDLSREESGHFRFMGHRIVLQSEESGVRFVPNNPVEEEEL